MQRRAYYCGLCDTGLIAGLDEPMLANSRRERLGGRCFERDSCRIVEVAVEIREP